MFKIVSGSCGRCEDSRGGAQQWGLGFYLCLGLGFGLYLYLEEDVLAGART